MSYGSRYDFGPAAARYEQWNPPKHPGHAAAALRVEAVYAGAQKLC